MADEKQPGMQTINLTIGGNLYSFDIDAEDKEMEEVYRLAGREVNNYLANITEKRYKNWKDRDYLALTAMKFACDMIYMRRDRQLNGAEVMRLEQLAEQIDEYLNAPEI